MLGRISQIFDSSVVDGPGNRTAIFFQGCNFNCHYCHNPETISSGSSKQDMELSEVGDILQEYLNQSIRYKLIPFRPHGVRTAYGHWQSPDLEEMERLNALALAKGFNIGK